MGTGIDLDLSAIPAPRLTVQQYAEAWRVAHAARGFGPYNAAGYEEVLIVARVRLFTREARFAWIFGPAISAELEARCDAYLKAMRKNERRR